MLKTETYYLIDFENVNESGLSNIENLTVHDHIHIFSTENAPKISFHTLVAFNKIDFNSHIVPTGNQSLDMHLIAYLGYLIGKNQSNNCKYVIISKDTDYDHSISFLKKIANVKICRQTSLCLTSKTKNSALKKKAASTQLDSKTELNTKIQRAISNAAYDNKTISYVAFLVCKKHGCTNAKQTIYTTLIKKYGAGRGLNLYNHVKKYI